MEMEITPLQEEILTMLYNKAYKTEPSKENVEKYNEFIGEQNLGELYKEYKQKCLDTYVGYCIIIFTLLMWYFWDNIYFVDPLLSNPDMGLKILGATLVFSFVFSYFHNTNRRKIMRFLKPFEKMKASEKMEEQMKKQKELKEERVQQAKELREKYL